MKLLRILASLSILLGGTASADVIINGVETGGDVVFSYTGSIDLVPLGPSTAPDVLLGSGGVDPANGAIIFSSGGGSEFDLWIDPTYAFPAFGVGSLTSASATGTPFGVFSNGFGIDTDYASFSPISGSMTFDNQTFASLGITPGTYMSNLPGNSITLNIGAAGVPEPATLALLGIGLAGLGFNRRKRGAT